MIRHVSQNIGVCEVCELIPKGLYQASYLSPSDFPNNFS